MSPYEISLLLHFYTTPSNWVNNDIPLYHDTVKKFVDLDLIRKRSDEASTWRTTVRGDAMCIALERVPVPSCIYVDQLGNKLIEN